MLTKRQIEEEFLRKAEEMIKQKTESADLIAKAYKECAKLLNDNTAPWED